MMKKIITYLILSIPLLLTAQSLERQVVAAGGTSTATVGSVTLSQTVGESMVKSFTTSSLIISEGFQQTNVPSVNTTEFNDEEVSIVAYPNPVTDQLTLDITTTEPLNLSLTFHDVLGREIKLEKQALRVSSTATEKIDCNGLAAGTYFLKIQDQKSDAVKSIRIEKIR